MKIGAMNHPTKDPVEEIWWFKENNFDFIDFTYEPFNQPYDVLKIKNALKKTGLEVVGHSNPTLPAIYPSEPIRKASFQELLKGFNFFKIIGTKKVNIHPFFFGPHMTDSEKVERNIELLGQANSYCRQIGLTLMIENFTHPFDNPTLFKKLIKNTPGLKMHLDIGHCNIQHDVIKQVNMFFKLISNEIIHLHIHDNKGKHDDHLPLGCGEIPWHKIIGIIKSHGYNDTITLEVFCEDQDFLLHSKKKLEEIIG